MFIKIIIAFLLIGGAFAIFCFFTKREVQNNPLLQATDNYLNHSRNEFAEAINDLSKPRRQTRLTKEFDRAMFC
jgi:hypothetical protein